MLEQQSDVVGDRCVDGEPEKPFGRIASVLTHRQRAASIREEGASDRLPGNHPVQYQGLIGLLL